MVTNCPRYSGNAAAVSRVLEAHATEKSFICYGEQLRDSAIDTTKIMKYRMLIGDVHRIQPNLCFSQTCMSAAVKKLVDAKAFQFEEGQEADYIKTIALRLRTLCCHVAQAESKECKAPWLMEMPWRSGHSPQDSCQDAEPPDTAAQDFIYAKYHPVTKQLVSVKKRIATFSFASSNRPSRCCRSRSRR